MLQALSLLVLQGYNKRCKQVCLGKCLVLRYKICCCDIYYPLKLKLSPCKIVTKSLNGLHFCKVLVSGHLADKLTLMTYTLNTWIPWFY